VDKPDDEVQNELPFPGEAASVAAAAVPQTDIAGQSPSSRSQGQILTAVKNAIEENRLDIYLQPMVTLPQRKVRFYEAVTRLRDDKDEVLTADDFIGIAEAAGLIGRIDHMVMLRCVQVLRRLMVRNKEVGVFCNIAAATLGNPATFAQCLDFLEANRALAPSLVLEFKQATFRNLGPIETENLAALAQRGYRFSLDHVTDLRIEPRELADRGVRYIKVPAALLLDQRQSSGSDIHPSSTMTCGSGRGSCLHLPGRCGRRGHLLTAGPLRTRRRTPMIPVRLTLANRLLPTVREWIRSGAPAMPRWRAAPRDRADRHAMS
jgi:cyclic-di-GMP phosphodiesterase TipF (flagellum assembly factor)